MIEYILKNILKIIKKCFYVDCFQMSSNESFYNFELATHSEFSDSCLFVKFHIR